MPATMHTGDTSSGVQKGRMWVDGRMNASNNERYVRRWQKILTKYILAAENTKTIQITVKMEWRMARRDFNQEELKT